MDSGNTSEAKKEIVRPSEAVVVDEDEASPQAETEQAEFYVEEEGDQEKPKSGMSQQQAHAAWKKEQKKRKQKQIEVDEGNAAREKLELEVAELKTQVGNISKGTPPTLESCDFDEGLLNQKMQEYYGSPKETKTVKQEPVKTQAPANDDAEFYLFQKEKDLTEAMPGYASAKESVIESLRQQDFPEPEKAILFLSNIAHQKGADIAKAIFAISKTPSLLNEILIADKSNNQIAIGDILARAASKVKSRTAKSIDVIPEPDINNSGPIDNASRAVAKLRQNWVDNPNANNYKIYQEAKIKHETKGK